MAYIHHAITSRCITLHRIAFPCECLVFPIATALAIKSSNYPGKKNSPKKKARYTYTLTIDAQIDCNWGEPAAARCCRENFAVGWTAEEEEEDRTRGSWDSFVSSSRLSHPALYLGKFKSGLSQHNSFRAKTTWRIIEEAGSQPISWPKIKVNGGEGRTSRGSVNS